MLVDLHVKSSTSNGVKAGLDDIFSRAKTAKLDGLAFCETLSTASCEDTLAAAEKAGIPAFVGVEIPTDKGILLAFPPEIDSFFLEEEWRQMTEFATPPAQQIIKMFNEIGGAVVASRPYDLSIPYNMGDLIFTLDNLHGVEVFNSRCGQIQCDFALEAAKFMGVPTCGGTDPTSADSMGRYATFFEEDIQTQQQFVNALRDSEYWAIQFGESPKPKRTPRSDDDSRGGRGGGGGGRGRSGGGRGRSGGGGGRGRSGGGRSGGGGRSRGRSKRD